MKRVSAWLPAILWMGVIFAMSAMPGDVSGGQSGLVRALVMRALNALNGGRAGAHIDPEALEFFIRKAAHMAEYAVLYLCYARALRMEGVRHRFAVALLLCAAYACTDEFHQSFTEGRGPGARDVLIDTAGAACAGAALGLFRRWRERSAARG